MGTAFWWFRRLAQRAPWRFAAFFLAVAIASSYSITLQRQASDTAFIWVANGIVVGTLLRAPRVRWGRLLVLALAAYLMSKELLREPLTPALALGPINLGEILIVATAVRRAFPTIDRETSFLALGRVAMGSTLVACALSASAASLTLFAWAHAPIPATFSWWFRSHVLGMVIVATSTLIILTQGSRLWGARNRRLRALGDMLLLLGAAAGVFYQSTYPLLFAVFPFLIYLLFRYEFAGLVFGVAIITLVTHLAVSWHTGPFELIRGVTPNTTALVAQAFLGVTCLVAVPIALSLADRRRLLRQITTSETRYRVLAAYASDLVMRIARDGARRYVSPSIKDLLGWDAAQFAQAPPAWTHPEDRAAVERTMAQVWAGEKPALIRYRLLHRAGYYVWIEAILRLMPSPDRPDEQELIYAGRDVTESVVAEEQLADSEMRLRIITDSVPAIIAHIDASERYTFINERIHDFEGQTRHAVIGRTIREVRGEEIYGQLKPHIDEVLQGREITFDYRAPNAGTMRDYQCTYLPATTTAGEQRGFYALTTDISRIKQAERQLAYLANNDPLTGLANRRHFTHCAQEALERANRQGQPLLLLLIDVDRFKQINDGYGHQVGDLVLSDIADRLRGAVRKTDVVARLGGDEFVVLCEGVATSDEARLLATKIHAAMHVPITLPTETLNATLSIGVALARDITALDQLMAMADKALYEAKRTGRAKYSVASTDVE